jgi:hypothetical protein
LGVNLLGISATPTADEKPLNRLQLDAGVWAFLNERPEHQTKFLLETLLFHKKPDGEDFWERTEKGTIFEVICKHLLASHLSCSPESVDTYAAGSSGTQGDGGVDLVVEASPGMRWIIDAKAKGPGQTVTPNEVRSVIGALMCDPKTANTLIGRGVLITNATFTTPAKKQAARFNNNFPSGYLQCKLLDGAWVRETMIRTIKEDRVWLMSVLFDLMRADDMRRDFLIGPNMLSANSAAV